MTDEELDAVGLELSELIADVIESSAEAAGLNVSDERFLKLALSSLVSVAWNLSSNKRW